MPALIAIALKAAALVAAAHLAARFIAKVPERPELPEYGDVPHIPVEARAATRELRLGGGSELRKQRPRFAQVIAHDDGGR